MGVLPFKNASAIINMEMSLLQLQEQISGLVDTIPDLPSPVESARRRRIRRRTRNHDMRNARARFEEEINELKNTRHRLNSRRMRRYENTRMLLSLFPQDDICFDVCFENLAEYQSVFSQLFTDPEKMNLWNNFVEMSEEEQAAILGEKCEGRKRWENCWNRNNNSKEIAKTEKKLNDAIDSQDERYANVDSRMKAALGVGDLYADQLEAFEHELTEHFTKLPKVKCVKWVKLNSDRMLLHAASQWLFLKSQSDYDSYNYETHALLDFRLLGNSDFVLLFSNLIFRTDEHNCAWFKQAGRLVIKRLWVSVPGVACGRNKAGKRITTVTNPRHDFVAPKITLAAYLKEKNKC
ncbi:R3H domain-containing protein [Trichinella pseudospiralis]|uniref:R3H domain-containing protein 4 n=3 Tax=Trichinella pseudospiralis TaxID=6337 RepID=A0A0V1FU57_TRIPS|nr:R3H domain-containing protein 4 [Trichinella pseudospiralis]